MKHWRWRLAQEAEIRWWSRYLKKKSVQGYLQKKAAYWHKVLSEGNCAPEPGRKVLDAGCGPAGIFIVLKANQVDAVDPLLARYEARLPHFCRSDYPGVHFFAQKLEDFYPQTLYSCVFCLNAVNHVQDIERCFDVLANALEPGGTLALSADVHRFTWCKWLFRAFPGDILHPHQLNDADYTAMLKNRGLQILRKPVLKEGLIFRHYLYVAGKP